MGTSRATSVYCPGGRWTQVTWTAFAWVHYGYDTAGSFIKWRRYSDGPPWYWEGSFNGVADFWFPGWAYSSLEFFPQRDAYVTITAL